MIENCGLNIEVVLLVLKTGFTVLLVGCFFGTLQTHYITLVWGLSICSLMAACYYQPYMCSTATVYVVVVLVWNACRNDPPQLWLLLSTVLHK